MRIEHEYQGESIFIEIEPDGDGHKIRLPNGDERRIRARRLPNDVLEVATSGGAGATRTIRVPFARSDKDLSLAFGGNTYVFTPPAPRRTGKRASKTLSGALIAPMVGVVAEVLVTEGQSVEKGQSLVVLGAMKVYVTLSAPFAGTVSKIHVAKDDLVAHGAAIVDVEPASTLPRREGEGQAI